MPNRREAVHEFYGGNTLLTKAAAASSLHFHGPAIVHTAVVRVDLNGYSAWARNRSAVERAVMLDSFFSTVVPMIIEKKGVYFRDEGDCIVAIFSDYFGLGASYADVRSYCIIATLQEYGGPGQDRLTAKATVCFGDVAYFQKRHEVATDDWSAEGEAFVRAARLEAAIESKQHVAMYADDHDAYFKAVDIYVSPPAKAYWEMVRENIRVPGVGATAGWQEVVRYVYTP